MSYLLDTNAAIALLTRRSPAIRRRFEQAITGRDSIAVPVIVLFELWYGIAGSARRAQTIEALQIFLAGGVDVLPFDEDDARIAGELRGELRRAGTPIGPYDLLIAAQAIRTGWTLITANVREFARIPGLDWEDWSRS